MVTVTGERLQPELVVMSAEDYALLRTNRGLPMLQEDMSRSKIERIAGNHMSPEHDDLNALMDDRGVVPRLRAASGFSDPAAAG